MEANGNVMLPKIKTTTDKNISNGLCHHDSPSTVKAQTIDELHSIQKKNDATDFDWQCWKMRCLMRSYQGENTRAAYSIEYMPNVKIPCVCPHPKNVVLLACDAFGVLPPVSKLSLAQTCTISSAATPLCAPIVAGTAEGVKELTATFSACFGAAFLMLHPTKYAAMLAEKMQKHGATGWLVNTGWSGGSYGSGSRIKLPYTRKIIDAKKTEVFGLEIPTEIEGVPTQILDPENTWSDKQAYKDTLLNLGGLFKNNFTTFTDCNLGEK
ncbi:hypothetical protein Pint_27792 [Pistacia integerrima]|uniref:Uncharacterized protein n=1 Tax=Pistacia integerrima TaxID=434235 RepID=A0ACC0YPU5_9ROSI|nr:hypothetical protein Pint_27792 [Pistacia integerrima]